MYIGPILLEWWPSYQIQINDHFIYSLINRFLLRCWLELTKIQRLAEKDLILLDLSLLLLHSHLGEKKKRQKPKREKIQKRQKDKKRERYYWIRPYCHCTQSLSLRLWWKDKRTNLRRCISLLHTQHKKLHWKNILWKIQIGKMHFGNQNPTFGRGCIIGTHIIIGTLARVLLAHTIMVPPHILFM